MSLASLTPQQQEQVATFQSVTAEPSPSVSISLLSSCGWSVEQAVQTYLAIHGDGGAHAGSASSDAGSYQPPRPVHSPPNSAILPSPSPPPAAARAGSSSAASFMTPAARPAAAAAASSGTAAASSASRASGKPSTSPPAAAAASSPAPSTSPPKPKTGWLGSGLLGKGLGALGRAVWGGGAANADGSASSAAAPPRTPQMQFLHEFGAAYGPHVPEFFPGSYTDAVKEAKSRGRMLFIYLHCPTHSDTETFVRSTLCTESMCNFLRENFIAWAGTIKHTDAYKLCQSLTVPSFPYVAALAPQGSANNVAVVFRHTGLIDADTLITQLLLRMETHQQIVSHQEATRVVEQASAHQARSLREQQDLEYQESLLMDQGIKESQEREAAQMEEMLRQSREAEAAAEAERARAAAEEEARRQALEAERSALAAALPAEPPAGEDGVVLVSFRLPSGGKLQRRFRDSEPLSHVRSYIRSLEGMEAHGGRFRILSNFPRKVHDDDAATLASLKLGKQILFVVEAMQDDEE